MSGEAGSELYRRVETYGSRGIVEVASAEGASADPDFVRFLVPAGVVGLEEPQP